MCPICALLRKAAHKRAGADADCGVWQDADIADFATSSEKTVRSEADLFLIAQSRLDDLKFGLERVDDSDAPVLRRTTQETKLRSILAGRLRRASGGRYLVAQEEELADKKRTDFRLRVLEPDASVPIELKIAEKWSGAELLDMLEDQLLNRYVRQPRHGVFLVVRAGLNDQEHWRDPKSRELLCFANTIAVLQVRADTLVSLNPHVLGLSVVGIDLVERTG